MARSKQMSLENFSPNVSLVLRSPALRDEEGCLGLAPLAHIVRIQADFVEAAYAVNLLSDPDQFLDLVRRARSV